MTAATGARQSRPPTIGLSQAEIPSAVMQAVNQGRIVGYQGAGAGRPIFETVINGQSQRIAITVSDNGFVVGANPAGSAK
jgi:filamentous hemagglutinin